MPQLEILRSLIGWAEAHVIEVMVELDQRFLDEARNPGELVSWVNPDSVRALSAELAASLAATEIACALNIPERMSSLRPGHADSG